MVREPAHIGCLLVMLLTAAAGGCSHRWRASEPNTPVRDEIVEQTIRQVSYEEPAPVVHHFMGSSAPFAVNVDSASVEYWNLTLDEVIQLALANSSVLRDLGAMVIRSPELTPTIYDPSVQATDPRFGPEAALSAFDAQLASRMFYEWNDRALNNALLGGGTNFFRQDLWRMQTELNKRAATGALFSLRHNIEGDLNNAPANLFGTQGIIHSHAWTWITEAEVRQPLMQGAGVEFNRIAGPGALPGLANGVVIARVNTEISAADFQLAVRDYLSNVENAYWELVFAYRDLEARKKARDYSLEAWQLVKAREGQPGAEADKVAQAAEQYYRFQEEVETALGGRLFEGTRAFVGGTGGAFQGTGGVFVAERRLRLIMGIAINDSRLIRPTSEPVPAKVELDWDQVAAQAMARRTEIIRQRLLVKRRDLELIANRNFLLPTLDAVGRYRRRGLGPNLYDPTVPDPAVVSPDDLTFVHSGTNEWLVGLELNMPIGFRQASSGVRNAELALARERAILRDLERQIVHDVSNAVAEQARSFQLVQTAYNRLTAAERQVTYLTAPELLDVARPDFVLLLDAVRRLADAEVAYHRASVGYAVALKNLYLETGDLMQYCNVHYSEGQ